MVLHMENTDQAFLSDIDVGARYGVSRETPWRWAKNRPGFPGPMKISPNCTRWRLSDILAFEATLQPIHKETKP
jgi:prophage regulatory protein